MDSARAVVAAAFLLLGSHGMRGETSPVPSPHSTPPMDSAARRQLIEQIDRIEMPRLRLTPVTAEPLVRLDVGRIGGDAAIRTAWVHYFYSTMQAGGFDWAMELVAYDCRARTAAVMRRSTTRGEAGYFVSGEEREPPVHVPVAPGSLEERQLDLVCAHPIGTDWRQVEWPRVEPW